MAEKYYSISPYAYFANNPLIYTDPTGMSLDDLWRTNLEGSRQRIQESMERNGKFTDRFGETESSAWGQTHGSRKGETIGTDIVTAKGVIIGRVDDGENALYCAEELDEVVIYGNNGKQLVSTGGVTRIYDQYTELLSAPIGEVGIISVHPEFDALLAGRAIANGVAGGIVKDAVAATGGSKQWVRFSGASYSQTGKFKTFGTRWGASPKYAKKIENSTLRSLNQSLRQTKLPGNSWRVQDPGHFHWKKITK